MRAKRMAVFVAVALAMLPARSRADVIDRVLAMVGGTVITQSDVTAALTFGLVAQPPPGVDPIRAALDQMIRRELILADVARFGAGAGDPAAIEVRLQQVRARRRRRSESASTARITARSRSLRAGRTCASRPRNRNGARASIAWSWNSATSSRRRRQE